MILWKIKAFEDITRDELYAILKVRQEVFIVEQETYYLDTDDTDQKALHVWAELDNKVVAYCRVFNKAIKYDETSIGRVLTHPDYRGLKLGRTLITYAIQCIETRFKTSSVRISAQDYLLKFYGDFGFIATDKKYLEDNLPHTEMYRK
ncbi:GNAT family N-acetyltransferase [Chryseobacterium sp. POL2]|uniref:GNAT family N-acetyltransferase n=1 Tax=Chryseobacterium sp. POL2 TaxID=2713414 RepID=UPI0013E1C11B|nr:GNAT family N-acetyltransferase [Chryseobacterium sp. POL2]QIG89984.1 GNAT family N-acetyltransferase [Chryseobacterium sp. POL2]